MRGCVVVVVGVAVGVWRACACLFCPLKKNGACPEGFGVRWTEVMDLMNTVLGMDENTDTRPRTSEVRASLLASLLYIHSLIPNILFSLLPLSWLEGASAPCVRHRVSSRQTALITTISSAVNLCRVRAWLNHSLGMLITLAVAKQPSHLS